MGCFSVGETVKIIELTLHNFISYRHEIISLEGTSVAAIVGGNGVGKSSIVEAITYSLFGQTRAKSDDELSYSYNNEEKKWVVNEFFVKMKFELNGKIYQIQRGRANGGGTNLKFGYDNDFQLSGNTIKDTEKTIQNILGMDYSSFTSSVMLRQNEYDAMMEMSPSECKRVLMKIMGLDYFDKKMEEVKKILDDFRLQRESINGRIDGIEEELNSTNIGESEERELEIALSSEKKRLEDITINLNVIQKEYDGLKERYDEQSKNYKRKLELQQKHLKLQSRVSEIENELNVVLDNAGGKLKEILDSKDQISEIEKRNEETYDKVEDEIRSISRELNEIEFKCTAIDREIKSLSGTKHVCIKGDTECNDLWISRNLKSIEEKKIEKINLENKKVECQKKIEELSDRKKRVREKRTKISNAKMVIEKYSNLKEVKERVTEVYREKEKIEDLVKEASVMDDDINALSLQIRREKENFSVSNSRISSLNQQMGRIKERKKRLDDLRHLLEGMGKKNKELQEKIVVYEYLQKAFSKDGIPALIIENTVPSLENDANKMLELLTNGRIRLQFRLQKKLKGGGFSDSFEIFVEDENGIRSIKMFSGGEKFRVICAMHFSFSKFLTRRSGTKVRLFVIDEPSGLDQDGLGKLVEVITLMKKEFEQIFVISHLTELIETFPQTIVVEKNLTGSHVGIKKEDSVEDFL
jgi:DNA repair exonuclease SbcCD ATPase subunit